MIRRALGGSKLRLSSVGLGTWAFGAGRSGSSGLGPQDDRDSIATTHRALELGINWIDTAASYGVGHAERVVARALRGMAQRPYVFTKCGTVYEPDGRERHCLDANSIRAEVEGSLRRLELEALDLVYVHWPRPREQLAEAWTTLAALRAEGKIRHLGASNFSVDELAGVARAAPVTAVQTRYSLLARETEADVLAYCAEHRVGALVYSTLHHGLLSGAMTASRVAALPASDWRRGHPDFNQPRLSRNLELVRRLEEIAARHRRSCADVAIAWVLRHPAVTGAIVGARRPEQVDGLSDAARLRLSDVDTRELEAVLARAGAGAAR